MHRLRRYRHLLDMQPESNPRFPRAVLPRELLADR